MELEQVMCVKHFLFSK